MTLDAKAFAAFERTAHDRIVARCAEVFAPLTSLALNPLLEAGVEFIAADMPTVSKLTIHILAAVAEEEARMISARTKAALIAANARGTKLGNPNLQPGTSDQALAAGRIAARAITAKARRLAADIAPVIASIQAEGITSLAALASALTNRNIPTPSGRGDWHASMVQRVLFRKSTGVPTS